MAVLVAGIPAAPEFEPAVPSLQAQQPPAPRTPYVGPTPTPSPVERLGQDQLRVGNIRINTARRELSVNGVVNEVQTLEFMANTKGGFKAYESALELDTNAVNFNVACLLIGLDSSRAVPSRFQFDPASPQGDPVELFVEWESEGTRRRIRAEEVLYNRQTKTTMAEGPWVYTGSMFLADGNRYMAETDGTIVGFMHNASPIVENPRTSVGNYGDTIINPDLKWKAGMPVQLILRALPRPVSAPAR